MSTRTPNTLDYFTEAVTSVLHEGEHGWQHTWFRNMDDRARGRFEVFLAKADDPLAGKTLSPEAKFRRRVLGMAQQERERRLQILHNLAMKNSGSGLAAYGETRP